MGMGAVRLPFPYTAYTIELWLIRRCVNPARRSSISMTSEKQEGVQMVAPLIARFALPE